MAVDNATKTLGLRDLKKQRTRFTVVEVATRLFDENGYNETTLVQIAAAAEIAPSTLFGYFATKPDIVFALMDSIIESAHERIVDRPDGETASDAVLAWVTGVLPEIEEPYTEAIRRIPRIVSSAPELVQEQRLRYALLEDALADGFARDLGEAAGGMRARVMAAIAIGGMVDVWNAWYELHAGDAEFDIHETFALKAAYLREALEAGAEAIDSLPRAPAA